MIERSFWWCCIIIWCKNLPYFFKYIKQEFFINEWETYSLRLDWKMGHSYMIELFHILKHKCVCNQRGFMNKARVRSVCVHDRRRVLTFLTCGNYWCHLQPLNRKFWSVTQIGNDVPRVITASGTRPNIASLIDAFASYSLTQWMWIMNHELCSNFCQFLWLPHACLRIWCH